MAGTPRGYNHNWKYSQRTDYDTGRKFKYTQSKGRKVRAKAEGGFKRGSTVQWKIKGTEIRKGNKTTIYGIKKLGKYKIRTRRKTRRKRRY